MVVFIVSAVLLVFLFAAISIPYVVCGKKTEGEVVSSAKTAEPEKKEPEEGRKEEPVESHEEDEESN
jgi:hypothetical protein